ncbi:type III secretion system translocon subunit SctE [Pandoraea anhela]|uniref:Translocator protein BipB n=1 Tax=Pandoraea anhela TaxID=2508295 RepID=A0A5E4SPY1_9BURK|nr:type III secretion system translocon subunit SctE [Pandoraea anhela]VVD77171.1 Cell invasion protein SipB [Pandoraea anhela]
MSTMTISPSGILPSLLGPDVEPGVGGPDGAGKPPPAGQLDMNSVVKKIIENMTSEKDAPSERPADSRDLKSPPNDTRMSITYLLSRLKDLFSESSLADLQNHLKQKEVEAAEKQALAEQSQAEFDKALADAADAIANYEAALDALTQAKEALDQARRKLDAAKAALDAAMPGTPEYDAAKQAYDAAKAEYDAASGKYDSAKNDATKANDAAKDAVKKADDLLVKFLGEQPLGNINNNGAGDKHTKNMSELIFVMARLAKLLGDSANDAIQEDMKFFEKIRQAREADLIKKNQEYEAQVRKAEKMSKIFGIFGKVLGAVLAVVGVVGAVFTGGLSTTMTVIGVGLLADSIMGATTGFSLIGEALKPLMTHVVQPLAEKIGKFVGSMLEELGVPKEKAELIGNIVGVAAAAVVVIAAVAVAVVAGGAAAATQLGKTLAALVGDVVKKMVPDLLREAAKAGSKMLSQNLASLLSRVGIKEGNAQMLANTLRQFVSAGELGLAGTQATGNVLTGTYEKQASDTMADMMVSQDALEKITDSVKQSSDKFAAMQNIVTRLISQMSEAGRMKQETQRFVLNNVRA